jgi:carbonic anhydrase
MIKKIKFPQVVTLVALALVGLTSHAESANTAAPKWNYSDLQGGSKQWHELDAAFEKCASGVAQSPVDIGKTVKANLPALEIKYSSTVLSLTNNGHTIQANLPAGNTLTVGGQKYELLQLHFHTPSEETLGGKHLPMVTHFVHRNAAGELGVLGVLMKQGKHSTAYEPIFSHLPRPKQRIEVDELALDLAALLPESKGYYAYEGSLTTPPCSEGVSWMVLKTPVEVGAKQIKAFQRLFKKNARPVQPLNGRVIKESH